MANDFLNRLPTIESNRVGYLGTGQQPARQAVQPQQQRVAQARAALPTPTYGLQPPQTQSPAISVPRQTTPLQQSEEAMRLGLAGIQKAAGGDLPYLDILEKRYLGRTAAAGAARGAAQRQRATALGLDPTTQRAMESAQRRQEETALGQVRADIAGERARAQEAAQQQLAGVGMQVSQYERAQKEKEYQSLLNAGGAENIEKASQIYNELYGSEIDPYLAQQQDITRVLGQFATIPGITTEKAMQMARDQDALEFLGIDEQQARGFLDPIISGSSPLAQAQSEYQNMLDKGLITPEEYEDMIEFTKWSITNPEGVEIVDGYVVKDSEGNEIRSFKTKEEADAFVAKEGKEGYSISEEKYIGRKGEYEEYIGVEEGQYFMKGGNVYKVQEGEKIIVEPDLTNPFSVENEQILALGEDTKYYNKILDKQAKAVISDPFELEGELTEDSPLYQKLLKDGRIQSFDNYKFNTNEKGWAKDSIKYIDVLDKMEPNTLIKIGGKLVVYKGDERIKVKWDDDLTRYYFYDISTGKTINIKTSQDGGKFKKALITALGIKGATGL